MRFYFLFFITIYWVFLILAPLNAFAEDKIFTCKPVIAGYPQKDGKFYMEVEYQEPSSPLLDVIPTSQILIREEYVFYKNNPYRKFEILTPYEKVADSKGIKEMEGYLSSWDELLSFDNFRTFYFRYQSDEGYEALKRISINKKNTKTSEITIPDHDKHPAYFFVRNCEAEITKESIQINYPDDPNNKLS